MRGEVLGAQWIQEKRPRVLEDEGSILALTLPLCPHTSIHRRREGPGSKFSRLQEHLATPIVFLHNLLGSSGCSGAPLSPFTDLGLWQMGMTALPLSHLFFSIFYLCPRWTFESLWKISPQIPLCFHWNGIQSINHFAKNWHLYGVEPFFQVLNVFFIKLIHIFCYYCNGSCNYAEM